MDAIQYTVHYRTCWPLGRNAKCVLRVEVAVKRPIFLAVVSAEFG